MNTQKSLKFIAVSLLTSSSLFAQKQTQLQAFITKNDDTKLASRQLYVEKIAGDQLWYRINKRMLKFITLKPLN